MEKRQKWMAERNLEAQMKNLGIDNKEINNREILSEIT